MVMAVIQRVSAGGLLAVAFAGAATAETMPQLDFGNKLLTAQVVWGALIFVLFYLLASRWGLPQVASVLELRSQTIARDLDQARDAREAAKLAAAELAQTRRQASAQSQAALAEAARKAKEEAAALAADQEARLAQQLSDAEAQIAQARGAAMAALRQVATETAHAVVARVAGGAADESRVSDAVGRVLAERGLAA
jgi:F-type H+-transporting ATPase subunit b